MGRGRGLIGRVRLEFIYFRRALSYSGYLNYIPNRNILELETLHIYIAKPLLKTLYFIFEGRVFIRTFDCQIDKTNVKKKRQTH